MTVTRFIRHQIEPFQYEVCKPCTEAQPPGFILREDRSWLEDVSAKRDVARQVTP